MIQEELLRVHTEREKLEDKLAEAEIQKADLDELRNAIQVCISIRVVLVSQLGIFYVLFFKSVIFAITVERERAKSTFLDLILSVSTQVV